VGYFELKLHRDILGTPETYITYCKKGHNMSPLKDISDIQKYALVRLMHLRQAYL